MILYYVYNTARRRSHSNNEWRLYRYVNTIHSGTHPPRVSFPNGDCTLKYVFIYTHGHGKKIK